MAALGSIRFPHLGGTATATLTDDRTWTLEWVSPDLREMIGDVLDRIAAAPHGPEYGFYGPRQLAAAAEALGGAVVEQAEPDAEDAEPGRVY